MKVMTYQRKQPDLDLNTQVWRCRECDCFHVRAGEVLLTFTPQDFERFAHDVTECYCVQSPVTKRLDAYDQTFQ